MFTNKPCMKKFQHDYKQCDKCRHRASLNRNVNVHKQTMHEGVQKFKIIINNVINVDTEPR